MSNTPQKTRTTGKDKATPHETGKIWRPTSQFL